MGKQITLLFHIDDILLTHALPNIVSKHIKLLNGVHSQNNLLTVTRGKVHEHLGTIIDFR